MANVTITSGIGSWLAPSQSVSGSEWSCMCSRSFYVHIHIRCSPAVRHLQKRLTGQPSRYVGPRTRRADTTLCRDQGRGEDGLGRQMTVLSSRLYLSISLFPLPDMARRQAEGEKADGGHRRYIQDKAVRGGYPSRASLGYHRK